MKQYQTVELSFEEHIILNDEVDINLQATFVCGGESVTVKGFYAGRDTFKVRFLPTRTGVYHYTVSGVICREGSFNIESAAAGKHGILQADGIRVKCMDGTEFTPFGTTVYALAHQNRKLITQTLETLADGPFNKIRMCLFPKHYQYNHNEPEHYPFTMLQGKTIENVLRKDGASSMVCEPLWDVRHPEYAFWDDFEEILAQLDELGIVVDLILFHPYDRWGFSTLNREESLVYLDYAMRRLSAFPNLMWSLANEYDLVPGKKMEDWYDSWRID